MESIKNFIQLTEDVATAGQPKEIEFQEIAKAGYKWVFPESGGNIGEVV